MRDIVVLLPGVLGSVLQKDGKDLWNTRQATFSALTGADASFQQLVLEEDDPKFDDLGDGIKVTSLINFPHLVAGLIKIDGYSKLSRLVTDTFKVTKGSINDNYPANFFEFPYDWRRDNRVAARKLKKLIDERLPLWQEYSGAKEAKVIFLAHSMGGLVARYYLERLEGWSNCRALITFGTPYRGAVDTLNYLANGYKQIQLDLTEVMRSFTSIYQLLPIYEMVNIAGKYQRVAETDGIPNVNKQKAQQALAFHREIEDAINKHLNQVDYLKSGYKTIPIVGIHQDTFQSAKLSDETIIASYELPKGIDSILSDGDGTVPRLSAIPIELDQEYRETYIAQRHSYLQSSNLVLNDVRERLKQMQIPHQPIRGSQLSKDIAQRAAISLNFDDLYLVDEQIKIGARILNFREDDGVLIANITPIGGERKTLNIEFEEQKNQWVLNLDNLTPGIYRLEVKTRKCNPFAPTPLQDFFEVVK
ncbi:MAG: lecithin--cholesterol acyltransferase [Symploca sp. SIO2E9]|nr:lecithin--cholesterol acyltransferase [Symploca sp. SIO2E9]